MLEEADDRLDVGVGVLSEQISITLDGRPMVHDIPLAVGARTVVRVTGAVAEDPIDEDEAPYEQWEFGAEVVRLDAAGMGLRFVGIPLALRITHRHRNDGTPIQRHAA